MLLRLRGLDAPVPPVRAGVGESDDLHLALYLAYEQHFSALPEIEAADGEWDLELLAFRASLEVEFERFLRASVGSIECRGGVVETITAAIASDDGPSLSTFIERDGSLDQMREVLAHRSLYQLKEGDAHTFGIARLRGRAKQLLAEIQAGEYGADAPGREMHAALFAATMRALGVDERLHAHLDRLPASAFMISNLVSMFGLNRRWRGALVGHLTVFEMTSVVPMGRYARGLERMGAPAEARRFYEVHTLADAEHEVLAAEMASSFVADEPGLRDDVLFGAHAVLVTERHFACTLLDGFRGQLFAVGAPSPATVPAA